MATEKFAAYFMLLMVTSISLSVFDSHSKSDEEPKLLLGLSKPWWSIVSSISDFVPLSIQVWPVFFSLLSNVDHYNHGNIQDYYFLH